MIKVIEIGGQLRNRHADCDTVPGLRRLVVDTPLDIGVSGKPIKPIPALVESVWFDDLSQAVAAYGASSLADLITSASGQRFVACENLVMPGAAGSGADGSVKLMAFIKRIPGTSPEEFQRYWRVEHAPLVPRTPLLRRYVQSHLLLEHYCFGEPIADGTAELWWDDLDTCRQSWSSPEVQIEQMADSAKFLGVGHCIDLCREDVIFSSDAG
jgi:uncharacterized protein (TIGR02118 family)